MAPAIRAPPQGDLRSEPAAESGREVTAPPLVHFLEEQRRHRRTSAASAALVVVALVVSGIPLSILISPLVVAGAAVRALAGLDTTVPGAVAVHFLFPVWDPAVDRDDTRTDVTSVLLRMQLPLEPRLRRLQRLGASAERRPAGSTGAAAAATVREFAGALGWLGLSALLLGGLLAASALAAAAVLYLLGCCCMLSWSRRPAGSRGCGRDLTDCHPEPRNGRARIKQC